MRKPTKVELIIQDEDCDKVVFPIASYRQALRLLVQHLERQHKACLVHTPETAPWYATRLGMTERRLKGKRAFKPLHYMEPAFGYHIIPR
jgi:hypothetical protein